MATLTQTSTRGAGMTSEEKLSSSPASLGTVFEWYDFYLYATLAPFFASLFFRPVTTPPRCSRPSPPMPPVSWCASFGR